MEDSAGLLFFILYASIAILYVVAAWRIFEKAGKTGFLALIPILNTLIILNIAGKPMWWFILLFIPFVNVVVIILVANAIAERFGYGMGFTIGLLFLPVIFILILAFGDSEYIGGRKKKKYAY